MSLLDSKAVFESRLKELGIEGLLAACRARRIDTYGSFAYSCDYVPGSDERTSFFELLDDLGLNRRHPQSTAVRRLFYEAVSLASEELKAKTQRREDDPPRRLPTAERAARLEALQTRLGTAVKLRGDNEPSDRLLDKVVQVVEDGRLKYFPWEACTRFDDETDNVRVDRTWKPDSTGTVREVRESKGGSADISSDYLLRSALRRRSAAFEMGNLCSYEAHEDYVDSLLRQYHTDPPPGYSRVSLAQLERVDKEVFRLLAQELRGGLRPADDGSLPLTNRLPKTVNTPAVQWMLMPMTARGPAEKTQPQQAKRKRSPSASGGPSQTKKPDTRKQKKQRPRNRAAAPNPPRQSGIPMPQGLQGKASMDDKGARICFGFNLGTCKQSDVQPGQSCTRGKHVCANPGCFGPHPVSKCSR